MSLSTEVVSQVNPQTANSLRYGMQMTSYRSIMQNHDYSHLFHRDLYASMRYRFEPTEKSYSLSASDKIGSSPSTLDYYASAKTKLLFEYSAFRAEVGGSYSLSAYSDKSPQLFGLDAELSYTLKYGFSVLLVGSNLLNIRLREWVDISYSDLFRSERVYQSMPGYAMLKVRWEFGQNRNKTSERAQRRMTRFARPTNHPPRF